LTTDAAARAEDDTAAAAPPLLARFDRFAWWFAAIIVLQACWLAGLMASGWYYQADFANLAAATGRPLSWAYLSHAQGGHLDVIGRVVFWVLNRVDPLNHSLTIAAR